ncbi:sigma factor-like helix-turn-helix DNA-binding protein [Streptomyces sp. NPDC088354]|uniref:sigma factor-like helix-turn-helix DNA-binding protein n=1 Tax=unclassified Streptomyces TaxID=2593676 RepID=UPI0029A1C139|nr:sigma factor-like helix-turn-helix DNA-binding protein [Streptomyces sp. MI02-7b]MDX3072028.1 sigma factor-like helix-turn-helix DNA-binding protein [Streptomyces sp. MI02-7b]
MGERRAAAERLRDAEFAAFAAGAAGRLLHAATLLTGDGDEGAELLFAALSRTYADWFRLRGEDPYVHTRGEIVRRFTLRPRWRRPRGGPLGTLTVQERLVVVLRLYEGIAEEQTAAQLGMPVDRVRAVCLRAVTVLRDARPAAEPAPRVPEAAS